MVVRTKRGLYDIASPYCQAIGAAIAEARLKKNISQETLAFRSSVNRTHMTNIEKGRRSVGIDVLHRIVTIGLRMNMDAFFSLVAYHHGKLEPHKETSSVTS